MIISLIRIKCLHKQFENELMLMRINVKIRRGNKMKRKNLKMLQYLLSYF